MKPSSFDHITVLEQGTIDMLDLRVGATAIDCTSGGGGHCQRILNAIDGEGLLIAIDQDPDAIAHLESRFADEIAEGRMKVVHSRFDRIAKICEEFDCQGAVDGIVADLGVSSVQLDQGERGFSFRLNAPLDMRMDTSQELTAATVINEWSEHELADILHKYGEEPKARRIARAIVARRQEKPFIETEDFANFVKSTLNYKTPSKKHPATKAFQAIRIAVNQELEALETLLDAGFRMLRPGGRMAIISFHSLEDKLVKRAFMKLSGKFLDRELQRLPMSQADLASKMNVKARLVTNGAVKPSDKEVESNPRARSARLRVIEKVAN